MANDKTPPMWRNFAAWSAVGAIFYIVVLWGAAVLVHGDGMGAMLRSKQLAAMLGLSLIFSTAVVGFTSRKRPISLRRLRNFLIQNTAAIVACLLLIWGFSALARAGALGAMGASDWIAAVTGSFLVFFAFLGTFNVGNAHTGADLIDDEGAAEDLRERGRLFVYSFVWMAACGLLLIGLSLAGPGGVLSPAAALAGALVLIAVLTALGIAAWRLSDELGRTLSREAGNMAFYLILLLGGGWAMLAHLGVVAAPAPLDWLTLFAVLLFVASFIAVGRRKLLTR
ncbi:hypothetical protein [Nannocystis sp. SCPEA4]|uniref:hypothetical protein n=1 Tax=Nannocystis sp. SCPEA4 TaxID=2996787 RepID=UPI002270E962|nr:hypothetical protein [Nannocystis sp. SCPEA4]MCY1054832.1 hypothetical protein [Nannocystis sp. SCPEA4]